MYVCRSRFSFRLISSLSDLYLTYKVKLEPREGSADRSAYSTSSIADLVVKTWRDLILVAVVVGDEPQAIKILRHIRTRTRSFPLFLRYIRYKAVVCKCSAYQM